MILVPSEELNRAVAEKLGWYAIIRSNDLWLGRPPNQTQRFLIPDFSGVRYPEDADALCVKLVWRKLEEIYGEPLTLSSVYRGDERAYYVNGDNNWQPAIALALIAALLPDWKAK